MTNESSSTALVSAVKTALPSLSQISYNEVARMFLAPGYTSQAGNMYQEGARISKYLMVDYSIGHGYAWTFLNGLRIYTWDGGKPKLVASRCFSCVKWSEATVREETESALKDYLKGHCQVLGLGNPSDRELSDLSSMLVGETEKATCLLGR